MEDGKTALIAASENGHLAIVEILLKNKADLNAKSNGALTALMLASERGHKEIAEILKKASQK